MGRIFCGQRVDRGEGSGISDVWGWVSAARERREGASCVGGLLWRTAEIAQTFGRMVGHACFVLRVARRLRAQNEMLSTYMPWQTHLCCFYYAPRSSSLAPITIVVVIAAPSSAGLSSVPCPRCALKAFTLPRASALGRSAASPITPSMNFPE